MRKIFLIILSIAAVHTLSAQRAEEALRYANQNFYGTARSSAMGGAFSSLGGDMTVASTNPAGLAIFRSSTASITPGMRFGETKATGVNGTTSNFIMPSVGFIFTTVNDNSDIKNWNFGIVYTHATNFNNKTNLTKKGSSYSFLDDIAKDANNPTPYYPDALKNYKVALLPSLAYNTYLISPDKAGTYLSALQKGELMNRTSNLTEKGHNGEFAFSFAGNLNHTLYFGATLGVQNVNFKVNDNYKELLSNPTKTSLLDVFYYDKQLHTRGGGINFKAGLIYRPTDELRLGVTAHTPTFFSMEEEYSYVMESKFFREPEQGKGTSFKQVYPLDNKTGVFKYEYRTPWKFTFGGSCILGKVGLLSVDYDLIDYSSSKFTNGNFEKVNQEIKDTYKMTGNLKVGAELRITNQFSLRGGYNYFGNMYSEKSKREQKASLYSTGLGYRHKNIFVDASYQYYTQEYTQEFSDFSSTQEYKANTVKLTVGYQF